MLAEVAVIPELKVAAPETTSVPVRSYPVVVKLCFVVLAALRAYICPDPPVDVLPNCIAAASEDT